MTTTPPTMAPMIGPILLLEELLDVSGEVKFDEEFAEGVNAVARLALESRFK